MKTLITGGNGFIGRHLRRRLPDAEWLDIEIPKIGTGRAIRASILDRMKMREIVPTYDRIFHLAALTDVQESHTKAQTYHQTNVFGSMNLINSMRPDCRMIFASSCAAEGYTGTGNFGGCTSPYGYQKAAIEKALEFKNANAVRFYNVFGPGANGGVIQKFIRLCLDNQPLPVYGNTTRDFIYVDDLVSGLTQIADGPMGDFRLGYGGSISILALAHRIIDLFNEHYHTESSVVQMPALAGEIQDSVCHRPYPIDNIIGFDEGLLKTFWHEIHMF